MKIIEIPLEHRIDFNEFKKCISFISEDITGFFIEKGTLKVQVHDEADIDLLTTLILNQLSKFKTIEIQREKVIFEQIKRNQYENLEQLNNSDLIFKFSDGLISLKNEAISLLEFFDKKFKDIAMSINGQEVSYPTLLPIETLYKTGYLKTSPQYSIFCCCPKENFSELEKLSSAYKDRSEIKEILTEPKFTLSPAACFHTYEHLKDTELPRPQVFTFKQSVFRNEGRLNWDDFGRLRDYHVRETVFIGSEAFVNESREKMAEATIDFIKDIGLDARLSIAYDTFVMPKMQKFKKVQLQEESKYELEIFYNQGKSLAAASFNLHGNAFTMPFNISVQGLERTVTGCVGYGLERWVLAFLAQFGHNKDSWPECVKSDISNLY